jgi:hypothetical protein
MNTQHEALTREIGEVSTRLASLYGATRNALCEMNWHCRYSVSFWSSGRNLNVDLVIPRVELSINCGSYAAYDLLQRDS